MSISRNWNNYVRVEFKDMLTLLNEKKNEEKRTDCFHIDLTKSRAFSKVRRCNNTLDGS